jgi:hypothetical protein
MAGMLCTYGGVIVVGNCLHRCRALRPNGPASCSLIRRSHRPLRGRSSHRRPRTTMARLPLVGRSSHRLPRTTMARLPLRGCSSHRRPRTTMAQLPRMDCPRATRPTCRPWTAAQAAVPPSWSRGCLTRWQVQPSSASRHCPTRWARGSWGPSTTPPPGAATTQARRGAPTGGGACERLSAESPK